eukprot:GFYU01003370.1.p1 GENE.GFYU01003370.1~~GFYU01003370.1.p1  ORF type:complete len:688 (-),score=126.86 GFYU01003370.1:66-2129(-)
MTRQHECTVRLLCKLVITVLVSLLHNIQAHHTYEPSQSSSYSLISDTAFEVSYADGTHVSGVVHEDVVQIGNYFAKARFGGIEEVAGGHGKFVFDGILGFGFPNSDENFADPLFISLSNGGDGHQLQRRIFTLMLTDSGGELQLGGYDPDAIERREVVPTPVLTGCTSHGCSLSKYRIQIDQVEFGTTKLFRSEGASAVLDSGTSCLVLPSDPSQGIGGDSPMGLFWDSLKSTSSPTSGQPSIYVTVEGRRFEIPYKDYILHESSENDYQHLCVETLKDHPDLFVLGDVFFRSLVVIHDLTDMGRPLIKLGRRRPDYHVAGSTIKTYTHNSSRSSRSHTQLAAIAAASSSDGEVQSTAPDSISHGFGGALVKSLNCDEMEGSDTDHAYLDHCVGMPEKQSPVVHRVQLARHVHPTSFVGERQHGGADVNESDIDGTELASPATNFAVRRRLSDNIADVEKVDVYSSRKLQYATSLSVGTPRQDNFMVVVDTGSTILVMYSAHAPYSLIQLITFSVAGFFTVLAAGCLIYRHRLKKSAIVVRPSDAQNTSSLNRIPNPRINYGTYNTSSTYGTYLLRPHDRMQIDLTPHMVVGVPEASSGTVSVDDGRQPPSLLPSPPDSAGVGPPVAVSSQGVWHTIGDGHSHGTDAHAAGMMSMHMSAGRSDDNGARHDRAAGGPRGVHGMVAIPV